MVAMDERRTSLSLLLGLYMFLYISLYSLIGFFGKSQNKHYHTLGCNILNLGNIDNELSTYLCMKNTYIYVER